MIDTALFHDLICCMTGFNLSINCHVCVRYRAVPDIMVAFPPADKVASVRFHNLTHLLFILSH